MPVLTVERVKAQCVISLDHDDFMIETEVIPQAEAMVTDFLNRESIPWEDDEGDEVPVPLAVERAMLLTCAALLEHREGEASVLPDSAKALLWPHKVLGV